MVIHRQFLEALLLHTCYSDQNRQFSKSYHSLIVNFQASNHDDRSHFNEYTRFLQSALGRIYKLVSPVIFNVPQYSRKVLQ
jgi:hypothetical protein